MAGVQIARRSLNSVTQDLAPLMTIEDDDADEGVVFGRPSSSSQASSKLVCYQNSSSLVTTMPTPFKDAVPKASSRLKWILGSSLIISAVILNVSTPIYTLVISEKSDIFFMNLIVPFWTTVLFLATWIVQRLFFSKREAAEGADQPDDKLYFRPKYASFKTLAALSFINFVTNVFMSFSMLPSRTPKALQPILSAGAVVSATIFRKLLLNRGVSLRRIICLGAVLLGLFVAAEPEIFGLPMTKIVHGGGVGDDDDEITTLPSGNETVRHSFFSVPWTNNYFATSRGGNIPPSPTSHSIFWTVILLLSNIPAGLGWVLFEREATRRPGEVFLINFYTQLGSLLCLMAFFWIDLVPDFGQADSLDDLWLRVQNGFLCHYRPSALSGSHCGEALLVSFAAVASFAAFLALQVLLMAFTEGGSTFSIIVSYLSVPTTSVFWLLFDFRLGVGFLWSPLISPTSLFPVMGFSIMLPAIILFNLVGIWENQVTFDV